MPTSDPIESYLEAFGELEQAHEALCGTLLPNSTRHAEVERMKAALTSCRRQLMRLRRVDRPTLKKPADRSDLYHGKVVKLRP